MSTDASLDVTAKTPAALMMLTPDGLDVELCLKDLSEQQMQAVYLLSQGHTNKTIAYELGRSQATVKSHMSEIMRRLGCTNRTQAALLIFQWLSIKAARPANR